IGAYFAVRLAIKMILFRLFMLPFKMKGRALEGAMAVIHGVTPGEAPAKTAGQDEEEPKHGPLRYVWVDVTITPLPRSNGFTHWEPGELALAPAARKIKSLDDHDHCFHVSQVRVFDEGKEVADEGYKYSGPQRLKLLVGLPETQSEFQFVYYMEAFGKLWVERT
ncbi:MAG: hypothetical protein HYV26_13300, partial [Candidatus Hydrogenedentes bacterium]|nr:hypothetical protein [Candidatus Hydrogenedentota bacterium]